MDTFFKSAEQADAPLFRRCEAIEGGFTDRQIRALFQRVVHGLYTRRDAEMTHRLRCRAVAITLPDKAFITGISAATLCGVPLAGKDDLVEVICSGDTHRDRRSWVRSWARASAPDEYKEWDDVRIATPARAVFDTLAQNSLAWGVANTDAMLRAGFISQDQIESFLSSHGKYHRSRHAKLAFQYLDPRAESIPESILRVNLTMAGLTPTPQVEVRDRYGQFLARHDLAYEEAKVAVEYDGAAWHSSLDQQLKDKRRRGKLKDDGWIVIVVTSARLRQMPEVVAEVREALNLRGY